MERTKWTDRKFSFDFPEGWLADILERLRGTEARLNQITSQLSNAQLELKPDGKWNIKENIGHLGDIEDLHSGRMEDFIARKETLRAADMSNKETYDANHSSKSKDELMSYFVSKRKMLIAQFEKLDDETQLFKSMHPRLQTFMRPVDVAFFAAEHDDHHLADIREILKLIERK